VYREGFGYAEQDFGQGISKKMKNIRAVELFAGIGGFRLAADSLGIETIWANDVDARACAVYRDRFGTDSVVEDDIWHCRNKIPAHDILTGGFPCQPFSSAGKKQGIEDYRGTLFQAIIDVLRKTQPSFFVLENVKRLLEMERGWHFATILNSLSELNYRVEWRLLNASHFGLAQNRQRVFIVGVRANSTDRSQSAFDGTVRLASQSDLSSLTPKQLACILSPERWLPLEKHASTIPTWGVCFNRHFFAADLAHFSEKQEPVLLRQVMEHVVDPKFDFTAATLKWLHKNRPVNRFVDGVEILSNQAGGARMGYTIFGTGGIAPTLTATTSRHYERYKVGDKYRRLTNVEYARLQGFPVDHCRIASTYDQYTLFGNAVPPPMAHWVMGKVLGEGVPVPSESDQSQMALALR
jgi:DNA (cytosine-5)-methyltransferase 1